jgi:hypothetical protein
MPLPAVLAEGVLNLATSKTVQDLTATVWSKIFHKDAPEPEPDRIAEIVELVEQAATRDELATAFASLEARLTSVVLEQRQQIERRVMTVGMALGVLVTVGCLAIMIAVLV